MDDICNLQNVLIKETDCVRLVSISPATSSPAASLNFSISTPPSGADGMLTTLYPAIAALAGFVPCAESGTRIFVRFSSDRLS